MTVVVVAVIPVGVVGNTINDLSQVLGSK